MCMQIREILLKEEEKHRLSYIGLTDDLEGVIGMVEGLFVPPGISFAEDKERLLGFFYSRATDYREFVRGARESNVRLKKHHFHKTGAFLAAWRKGRRAALDEELRAPQGLSFAWLFPHVLYGELYGEFCRMAPLPASPRETDDFFFEGVRAMYPLDMGRLAALLERNEDVCWEMCARYLQRLSQATVAGVLWHGGDCGFADVIRDETWTEVFRLMKSRLVDRAGRTPVFGTGADFRSFLLKACRLTALALQRRYAQREVYREDLPPAVSPESEGEDEGVDFDGFLPAADGEVAEEVTEAPDINTDNPYEVAAAVSTVLLDSSHPLYKRLTEGLEDKVKVLIDRAVNGMSYQEIVEEDSPSDGADGEAFRKAVLKARKDFERVRKTLCARMREMAGEKNVAGSVTNPARRT
jgi:DNA-directed RNA polymerase specialized sigma24 family protein